MEELQKESSVIQIPYVVYESTQVRNERMLHRLIIVIILTILLLFVSNGLWLYSWMQYDYSGADTETTYQQDGAGYNNINTGMQRDINNGASVDDNDETKSPSSER